MGKGHWSDDVYSSISSNYTNKSTDDIFAKVVSDDMLPNKFTIRESRDSDDHPNSLAVMVFLDDTGSMGMIPDDIVRNELRTLMNTIIDNGVQDPQVLFSAVNDHYCTRTPIQVGQFESSAEDFNKWLVNTKLQSGGGGQDRESYLMAWYVAGRHTSIDCFEKRNNKGFLFTIGDERSWDKIETNYLKSVFGFDAEQEVTDKQLLEEAERLYNVYHIHVNDTSYRNDKDVIGYWKDMLGERLIILDDYHAICATIATLIAVQHGADMSKVTKGFDAKTAGMVTTALATLAASALVAATPDEGIMKL